MTVKIVSPRRPVPNKLADLELWFGDEDGVLSGTKLVGFTVWTKRGGGEDAPTEEDEVRPSYSFPEWSLTFPSRPWKTPQGTRNFGYVRSQERDGVTRAEAMRPIWALRDYLLTEYQNWLNEQAPSEFTD